MFTAAVGLGLWYLSARLFNRTVIQVGNTHSRVVRVRKLVPAVTSVTGTTVVKVEINVVGATDAVMVDTVVEVPVATRKQMLETRDAGSCATIEGVASACRGSSQGKV